MTSWWDIGVRRGRVADIAAGEVTQTRRPDLTSFAAKPSRAAFAGVHPSIVCTIQYDSRQPAETHDGRQ